MRLSVCITTWNTPELIQQCLDSVRSTIGLKDYEILILDLGHDKTLKPADDLKIWRHSPPSPYAVSNNFLAKQAKGKYILFLNSDAFLKKDCLKNMLAQMKKTVGAVGCRLLYPPGSAWAGLVQHAGIFIEGIPPQPGSAFTTRGFQQPDQPAFAKIQDVPAVTGACLLVDAVAFKKAGGFNEKFINGYEDVALCLSLWSAGWRVRYCGTAVAMHLGNGTKGTTGNTATAMEFISQNARVLKQLLEDSPLTDRVLVK